MVPPGISILLMYLWGRQHENATIMRDNLLVEKWLEDDDLVSGLDESHKRTQHSCVDTMRS